MSSNVSHFKNYILGHEWQEIRKYLEEGGDIDVVIGKNGETLREALRKIGKNEFLEQINNNTNSNPNINYNNINNSNNNINNNTKRHIESLQRSIQMYEKDLIKQYITNNDKERIKNSIYSLKRRIQRLQNRRNNNSNQEGGKRYRRKTRKSNKRSSRSKKSKKTRKH